MVVARFLDRKGPSGRYSQRWISRALQSLTRTTPKMCSCACSIGMGSPSALPGPTKKPISSSKSISRLGPKTGEVALASLVCPHGRRIGVPLTTIELAWP